MKFSRLLVSGFILTGLLSGPVGKSDDSGTATGCRPDCREAAAIQRSAGPEERRFGIAAETIAGRQCEAGGELNSLQQSLTSPWSEQQGKLVQPVNAVGSK